MEETSINFENESQGKINSLLKSIKVAFNDPVSYFQRQNIFNHISKSLGIEIEKVSHELIASFCKGGRSPLPH